MKASKCVFLRSLTGWFEFAPGPMLINVNLASLIHFHYINFFLTFTFFHMLVAAIH